MRKTLHDTVGGPFAHDKVTAQATSFCKHNDLESTENSNKMRPPLSPKAYRVYRVHRVYRVLRVWYMLHTMCTLQEHMDKTQAPKRRGKLVRRDRRPWETYIQPMLQDDSFKGRFRMGFDDFNTLVRLLRPALERNKEMGCLRNGTVPVEFQVALTLRWLAGASMYEGMDGHVLARSTAYQVAHRVIRAVNACNALDCKWPYSDEQVVKAARAFKERSSHGVIDKCVGALDGLFIRVTRPTRREVAEPNAYYSGHKKAFGMNFQVNVAFSLL